MTRSGLALVVLLLLTTSAAGALLEVPATYPTIQAAVDAAAPGDTVSIAPGTYEEQVVVALDLMIMGSGSDQTTIQSPVDLPHSVGTNQWIPLISCEMPAERVNIQGLTIDGLGRAPESGRLVGILHWRTGGLIEDVRLVNLHRTPVDDMTSGIGIFASTGTDPYERLVTVRDVVIERFQKAGLVASGFELSVDLQGLDIDPVDIYSDAVQNGIELSVLRDAVLRDCTVRNVWYDGDPYPTITASGLVALNCLRLRVFDCRLLNNQTGGYFVHNDTEIDGCEVVSREDEETYSYGMLSVGTLGIVAQGQREPTFPEPLPTVDSATPPTRPWPSWPVRLSRCTFTGMGVPASRGLAVRSVVGIQDLVITGCEFVDWNTGVISLEYSPGEVQARLSGSVVRGNNSFGAFANTLAPLDARGCWWGHPTGPFHPSLNPIGLGNTVSDNVRFDPWLEGNLAPSPLPQVISLADEDGAGYSDAVTVDYLGGADGALYGYSLDLSWDPAVIEAVAVSRPSHGSFADATFFQSLPTEGGVRVDAALGGDHPGCDKGPLLEVVFRAVGTPDWTPSPLNIELVHMRNNLNQPIGGFTLDQGQVVVDLQAPVIADVKLTNETLPHTDEYAKNGDLLSVSSDITDGDPSFGTAGIRLIAAVLWGNDVIYMAPDYYIGFNATWAARPAILPPDGPQSVVVEAWDPAGNLAPQAFDPFVVDNTPPAAITGLAATAGHNTVDLAWNDASGSDLNYRRTVVRAVRWGDYPFYDAAEPAYPAGAGEGEAVFAGEGTEHQQTYPADGSERDILYFGAFVEDQAGNVGPPDDGARARATNYRLGDVRSQPPGSPGDGLVDLYDMTRLGDTYDLVRADPGFDGDCDVAPADGGATGIPVPDESVDLEDLLIFADQFDLDQGPPPAPLPGAPPRLAWRQVGPATWALVLEAPCPRLKALHLAGDAQGQPLRLEAGELLRSQPYPWFLAPGRDAASAGLAMLGRGVGIVGTGELLRLVAAGPVVLPRPALELRDVDGAVLESGWTTAVADPDLPAVFHAGLPTPNPFNPSCEIAFELPAAQRVRLVVYSLDGRRVAELVNADLDAGRHAARWQGRDQAGRAVAAGTYLYRLSAGPWTATGKLELVK